MKFAAHLTCLAFLLAVVSLAQTTTSSDPQQPAASPQVQSDTKVAQKDDAQKEGAQKDDAQKDADKKDDSKVHVRLGGVSVFGGYSRFSGPFFFNPLWPYGFYPYSYA